MISAVNVTNAASEVVPANANRQALIIQNVSDADVFLKLDGSATEVTPANGLKLAAGGLLTLTTDRARFINPVRAIHAGAGNKELRVQDIGETGY